MSRREILFKVKLESVETLFYSDGTWEDLAPPTEPQLDGTWHVKDGAVYINCRAALDLHGLATASIQEAYQSWREAKSREVAALIVT